ncbi:MAG TPA: S-methyl-5-thioribose-1-phosphate isomerase [Dehalococcoidales bacterium]|nr:S-methyl-5-thioribose-1-phosphate isomerase [Dehalococcoidales bacterium]
MPELQPLKWENNRLILLDQTRLPGRECYLKISDYKDLVAAIKRLAVRGAPAIGIAAAYGTALGALETETDSLRLFKNRLNKVIGTLWRSRPTARNLFWALERQQKIIARGEGISRIREDLIREAVKIHQEQILSDEQISRFGAALLNDGGTILTHCNAGALATGGCGTALGIIKKAFEDGHPIHVMATETRPLLQGARLTAFELKRAGIPFTLITDSMAGTFMRQAKIQAVITGADRIARNGDTANKIGTYTLAVLAKEHGIPFYIAAPTSTLDLSIYSGKEIIIEERSAEEVTSFQGVKSAPKGIKAANPSFDITPHEYITAIVTEKGIVRGQYHTELARQVE